MKAELLKLKLQRKSNNPDERLFASASVDLRKVWEAARKDAGISSMNEVMFKPLGMISTTFRSNLAMTYSFSQGDNFDAAARTPVVVRPVVDNVIYWPAGYLQSRSFSILEIKSRA